MDELLVALIASACVAGAYRLAAREDPRVAPGWLKKADQWSARTTALADRVAGAAQSDRKHCVDERRPARSPKRWD